MTDDLVKFLRDRLEEDRLDAFEAGNGGYDDWIYDPALTWHSDAGAREAVVRFQGSALAFVAAVDPVHGKYGTWNARHIARHDPRRVLHEVDAKRRLIDRYERAMEARRAHPDDLASAGALLALHGAVTLLAMPFSDHPDYRPEWAPEA